MKQQEKMNQKKPVLRNNFSISQQRKRQFLSHSSDSALHSSSSSSTLSSSLLPPSPSPSSLPPSSSPSVPSHAAVVPSPSLPFSSSLASSSLPLSQPPSQPSSHPSSLSKCSSSSSFSSSHNISLLKSTIFSLSSHRLSPLYKTHQNMTPLPRSSLAHTYSPPASPSPSPSLFPSPSPSPSPSSPPPPSPPPPSPPPPSPPPISSPSSLPISLSPPAPPPSSSCSPPSSPSSSSFSLPSSLPPSLPLSPPSPTPLLSPQTQKRREQFDNSSGLKRLSAILKEELVKMDGLVGSGDGALSESEFDEASAQYNSLSELRDTLLFLEKKHHEEEAFKEEGEDVKMKREKMRRLREKADGAMNRICQALDLSSSYSSSSIASSIASSTTTSNSSCASSSSSSPSYSSHSNLSSFSTSRFSGWNSQRSYSISSSPPSLPPLFWKRSPSIDISTTSSKTFMCTLCGWRITSAESFSFHCGHVYCLSCVRKWVRELIKKGQTDGLGCRKCCHHSTELSEDLIKQVAGEKTAKKYRQTLFLSSLSSTDPSEDYWCSRCETGVLMGPDGAPIQGMKREKGEGDGAAWVECQQCGHQFCTQCHGAPHENMSCKVALQLRLKGRGNVVPTKNQKKRTKNLKTKKQQVGSGKKGRERSTSPILSGLKSQAVSRLGLLSSGGLSSVTNAFPTIRTPFVKNVSLPQPVPEGDSLELPDSVSICLLGDGGVGLTAFAIMYVAKHFVDEYDPTIEDWYSKQVRFNRKSSLVRFLDTAGQEEFYVMRDHWINSCEFFVFMYSIISPSSLLLLPTYIEHVHRLKGPRPSLLIGNKLDREKNREVPMEDGKKLAEKYSCRFLELSSKDYGSVCQAMELLYCDICYWEKTGKLMDPNASPSILPEDAQNIKRALQK